jgi:Cytochrome c
MKKWIYCSCIISVASLVIIACNDAKQEPAKETKQNFGGYETAAKWGEHLVLIAGCHDCHTPKKMTPQGPDIDFDLALAGHIAGSPEPQVNRKELQDKGLFLSNDLTTWVGPWGVSYTANLTSDSTGIGTWKEEQFLKAIKEGKSKGLDGTRMLLPPMPWQMIKNMTDDELKAIFAYLKTTKPIKNIVPQPLPPETN